MADRTAGHKTNPYPNPNGPQSGKNKKFPLNGPIMRQNKTY